MSSAEEKKPEAPSSEAPAAAGGSKLVLILTVVNLLVCLGMAGVLMVSFKKDQAAPHVGDIHGTEAPHGEEHAEAPAGGHGEEKKADGHGGGAGEAGKEAPKKAAFGKMLQLEQFTVNLSTPGGAAQKFIRVNISLEVPNEEAENEVNQKMPQVRNAIIDLFNSKRAGDLATSEGREFLKDEIRSALNSFMAGGKVKGVYFTNFAITS